MNNYQGWTNPQTWCVSLVFLNNEAIYHRACACVATNQGFPNVAKAELKALAQELTVQLYEAAPWVWTDSHGESVSIDVVSWSELFASLGGAT